MKNNYLLYGEESYLIQKEIEKIIDANITFEKEMNTSFFDITKTNMEEIIAAAQTIPFFSDKKVMVLQHCLFLSASKNNTNFELLEQYFASPNESTIMVLVCPTVKLDSRKKIVKQLTKICETKEFHQFDEFARKQFVESQCRKRNIVWQSEALETFYHRVGFSPLRILQELDKLSLYSLSIAKEDVIAMLYRPLDDNMFDLFQALIRKDFKKVYQYWLDFKFQNIEPIALIATLASQYRFMYQVKVLEVNGYYKSEISRELGAHPYRVEKTMEVTSYLQQKEIAKTLNDLAILDQNIKAGKIDKSLGFELFLIQKGK